MTDVEYNPATRIAADERMRDSSNWLIGVHSRGAGKD
jgi:hypothetical protein